MSAEASDVYPSSRRRPFRSALSTCGPAGIFGIDLSDTTVPRVDRRCAMGHQRPLGVAIKTLRLERR